jgi:hypothetical protein
MPFAEIIAVKEVRTMHRKLPLVYTAVGSLLVSSAAVRADFSSSQGTSDPPPIPFTVHAYVVPGNASPDSTIYRADPPGTGYVQLVQPPAYQHFSGAGSIVIPLIASSTASADRPDQFTPRAGGTVFFQVQLFITDDSAPGPGSPSGGNTGYTFARGYFIGSLSAHHSDLRAITDSAQGVRINDHVFQASFPAGITGFDVAAPDASNPISFVVNIKAADIPPVAPEPSSVALALFGLGSCAAFAGRNYRRKPARRECSCPS